MENGRIAMAALTIRYALPLLQRGWPMFVDLSTTDLVYPSSCVASSRSFVKAEPKVVDDFLRAYIAAIQLIKKDQAFAERTFAKWLREKDPSLIKKTVESYGRLFKPAPFVRTKGSSRYEDSPIGARSQKSFTTGRNFSATTAH
jgi:ABC-type nitrate/sulfonate/bicarbonate transport system substrate-binding protein